jgi:hypothetical protein
MKLITVLPLGVRKCIALCIALAVSSQSIFSQQKEILKKTEPKKEVALMRVELFKQDFTALRDSLQKLHPGLYRYRNKEVMDYIFDSSFATIRSGMTVPNFYALTSFIIASIGDGHTNCNLSRNAMNDFYGNTNVFPAMVMFIHNKAFIFCCKQNAELKEAELISINNHPMNEIIQKLFKYVQSDGFIESHKNSEILEKFQLLFSLVYGERNDYSIAYKTSSGEIRKTTLKADAIKNVICANPFPRITRYLNLTQQPNNVAVLSIKTFSNGFLEKTGENFSRFLDSTFNVLKNNKVQKLLIDIRGNQGGNDANGQLLYSYLTSEPFKYYAGQETVKKKLSANDHPNLLLQQPKINNYKGKIFILADGNSFSVSAEFASIVKTNKRGKFIGEDCGGGYVGNTSGNETNFTLPNSEIAVRIPMVKYSMAVKSIGNKVWGIRPDYPAYSNISDIINAKDGQLDYAINLIGTLK